MHLLTGLRQCHVRDAEALGQGSHRLWLGETIQFLAGHTLLHQVPGVRSYLLTYPAFTKETACLVTQAKPEIIINSHINIGYITN